MRAFEALAAYTSAEQTYHATDGAETWRGYRVTGNLLPMLGVAPLFLKVERVAPSTH